MPLQPEQSLLHRLALRGERIFDFALDRLRTWLGRTHPQLEIVAYRTYGTSDRLEVRGRILARRGRLPAHPDDSAFRNVHRVLRAFNTREMPGVHVFVEHDGLHAICSTDEEGYFRTELPAAGAVGWTPITVTAERAAPVEALALVPAPTARFLVISDIDDTILPTGATRTVTLLRNTFLGNSRTRTPFPGIADFYHDLVSGSSGNEDNPVFYVSSSPWNLYEFMVNFMAGHGLPAGPVMLRDIGIDESKLLYGSHHEHKLAQIRKILGTYLDVPAVLVGDSGQHDPEIYTTIASEHPGRVKAIYVRTIGGADRQRQVAALAAGLEDGVPVITGADTAEFAAHARTAGLIS